MNTTPLPRPRLLPYLGLAVALTAFGHFTGLSYGASSRTSARSDARMAPEREEATVPNDPYVAFLDHVGGMAGPCKTQTDTIKKLLDQRSQLLGQAGGDAPDQAQGVTTQIASIDEQIATAQGTLNTCLEENLPAQIPPVAETPPPTTRDGRPIDPEKLREPYIPPVPRFEPVPVPSAPAGESAYLEFQSTRAHASEMAQRLVDDLRQLFDERRQAAARYLTASPDEHSYLAAMINTLSQRIAETSLGIDEALAMAQEQSASAEEDTTPEEAPASDATSDEPAPDQAPASASEPSAPSS